MIGTEGTSTKTETFTITLSTSTCPSATITTPTITTQTQYITDNAITINIAAFTSNKPANACGTIAYSAYSNAAGAGYIALDASIFVFTVGSPSTLTVQSNLPSQAKSY